jgi:glycosyltransferase involved in cell wall biosynthesis
VKPGSTVAFFLRTLANGGVETHLMLLGRGLIAAGFQVVLVSDGESRVPEYSFERYSAAGFICRRVTFPGPNLSRQAVNRAMSSAWQVNALIQSVHPDLIHVHYPMTSGYAQAIHLLRGVPFVSTLHLTDMPTSGYRRFLSFWGERVITPSREGRDFLIRAFGVDENRIRLVPHGTDEQYFRPPSATERRDARGKLGLAQDDKVVGMIARMDFIKGQDVLLKSLVDLRARGMRVVALLAGVSIDGTTAWRDKMREYAERAGIAAQVRLLGHADTRDVLWASDVCVLPSRQEGFAVVIIEAMLCGVVPIRTPAAGAAEQIDDGTSGFIVPFEDSAALAERLYTLLSDPDCRSRMSAATLEKGRTQFSEKVMVDRTIGVYHEVLQRPAALGALSARHGEGGHRGLR